MPYLVQESRLESVRALTATWQISLCQLAEVKPSLDQVAELSIPFANSICRPLFS